MILNLKFIIPASLKKYIYQFQVHHISRRNLCSRNACNAQNLTWESVVGLEIHAQINAKSKLFSSSATLFNSPTNSQVAYFDAALPGCLPVLNRYCVEAAILTALALNCKINKVSTFDRKHYFYPDLPAGYQITQQFHPLASNGCLNFHVYDTHRKNSYESCAHLKQLQIEQDSGRSFHFEGKSSFVDLNRAGIGLMELVFEPTLKNGSEAAALVKELTLILRSLNVCTCNMEEGALRVDANISVNRTGEPFGVKTEVKNINSLRYIAKAVDFEIDRQIKVIEDGGIVSNETRAYDYSLKKTIFMRDKEKLQDYRFMPEPNLPPIRLCDDDDFNLCDHEDVINIDRLKERLPSLPSMDRSNLVAKYGVTLETADRLVNNEGAIVYFEKAASRCKDNNIIVDFILCSVQHQLNVRKASFLNCPITTDQVADIIELLEQRTVSKMIASDILEMLFNGDPRNAADIVKEYNWYLITDGKELEQLCRKAMAARPKMVQRYRKTQKKRYIISLLSGLNEIANNRACIQDAENVFIRLIGTGKKIVENNSSQDPSDKES